MRVARLLFPVLIALLALAGPGLAAERSGGLSDAAGDVTSADGFARPDVAEFRVAYDPETGSLVTTVRFHSPVPRRQNNRDVAFRVTYNTGRAAPEGYCDWTHTGDLGVRIDVVRAPEGDFIDQTATPRPSGPDVQDNTAGSFSGDNTVLTVRTVRPQFAGRDYTCVSPMRATYGQLSGADEVEDFFFTGFDPGPPVTDSTVPSVRWENPASGATMSGVYSEGGQNSSRVCRLSASDNVRVNRIEIFVDGVLREVQRFAPWGCEIDTRTLTEGMHVLRADAYDEAGNRAQTAISVTVRNAGVAPPPAPPPVERPPSIPVPAPTPTTPPAAPPVPVPVPVPPSVDLPVVRQQGTPNVISRLEPFMRCQLIAGKVRACRFRPGAALSVRVTGTTGAVTIDRSGAMRLRVTCRPAAHCASRALRLRTPRLTLASLLRRPALKVGTVVEFRLTRARSVGSYHRLTITPNGPKAKTCELRGGRPRSCE